MADFEVDYTGAKMAGSSSDLSLSTTGGTMTGPLILAGPPKQDREAATKQFVEDTAPNVTVSDTAPALPADGDLWVDTSTPVWNAASLAGAWVNYDSPPGTNFHVAGYFKDAAGFVHLRGLVKSGSGLIFTLPTGYRPLKWGLFLGYCLVGGNPTAARIDVYANGQVVCQTGSATDVSLEGITFAAGF